MDDEVLGCGGLMAQIDPRRLFVHYLTKGHPITKGKSISECQHIQDELGYVSTTFVPPKLSNHSLINRLSTLPMEFWVNHLEKIIADYLPNTLLIPYPDYNQDHRVIFEAAITASRVHDQNHYVKNVLAYESPCTQQTNRLNSGFVPHVFLPIDIDKKLELYQMYESQVRAHRSMDYVRHLAGVRGMQCGKLYAEAFMAVRITA
jgi:LmbE family N-acetylglucosaminyl deacetylase